MRRDGRERGPLGLHLRAGEGALKPVGHHPIAGIESGFDDPQLTLAVAGLDHLALNDIVGADNQHIRAFLAGPDGVVRRQERVAELTDRRANAGEQPRQQLMVLVVEYGANKQGAGRLVDLRRRVVHVTLVRIAVLPLQPDLDRDAGKVCGPERKAGLGVAPLDRKDLRLAQVEIHVHRIGLHDGRQFGRPGRADKGADVDEVMRHGPVEGRNHTGIAEVGLRKLDRRLRVEDAGGSLVAVGLRLLEHGLAGKIVLGQGRLPLVLGVVVGEFRLV